MRHGTIHRAAMLGAALSTMIASAGAAQAPGQVVTTIDNAGEVPTAFYFGVDRRSPMNARCPDVGSWDGSAILAAPEQSYCRYVWLGGANVGPDVALLEGAQIPGVFLVYRDVPAVVPQQDFGAVTPGFLWRQSRRSQMLTRAGADLRGARFPALGKARVVVIDSGEGHLIPVDGVQDTLTHGRDLALIMRELACTSLDDCNAVRILMRSALRLESERDGASGRRIRYMAPGRGSYGTRGDLARAIVRTTREWLADSRHERLVINLSLGWSGCWNDRTLYRSTLRSATEPLFEDPVYGAILHASCHGALVVAAAGNVDAVPECPTGSDGAPPARHMFPARFLGMSSVAKPPSPEICRRLNVEGAVAGPLLLAVSAVDDGDQPLSIAAQNTSLVAFGGSSAARVPGPAGGAMTNMISGTSVSAAVVSAIAATVWSTQPGWDRTSIAELLHDSAVPLALPPGARYLCDSAVGGCESVRRASLCSALFQAAGADSRSCGPAAGVRSPLPWLSLPAPFPAPLAYQCGRGTDIPCHASVGYDAAEQPWAQVGPQPDGRSCSACGIRRAMSPRRFQGYVPPELAVHIERASVEFRDGTTYPLWDDGVGVPPDGVITRDLCHVPYDLTSALLRYAVNEGDGDGALLHRVQEIPVQPNEGPVAPEPACDAP